MLVAILFAALGLASTQDAPQRAPAQFGICEKEAPKLVGVLPVPVGENTRQPKRVRYVPPKYPALPPGTSKSPGVWAGEFLIGIDGTVVQVWPIREFRFTPPFPPFNQVIVDSIKGSLYEPLKIDGRPIPVCVTMTVNVDW